MSFRGALCVFEGIDHSGKTAQATILRDTLIARDIPAALICFPDRTSPSGIVINAHLAGTGPQDGRAVHLLYSANRWEKRDRMVEAINTGTTLIVDRYSYSGAAYSIAKNIPGMNREWCMAPERGLPCPDIVFYLSIGATDALARGVAVRERYDTVGFLENVRNVYENELFDAQTWVRIDATRSIESIAQEVADRSMDALSRAAFKPLRYIA
jgi:dTMP kinase